MHRLLTAGLFVLTLGATSLGYAQSPFLDPSFGQGGTVHLDVPESCAAEGPTLAYDLALDAQQRLLIAGEVPQPIMDGTYCGSSDFFVMRLLPDGTPDPDFGMDGGVRTSVTDHFDYAFTVGVQRNGRVIAAGISTVVPNGRLPSRDLALVAYTAEGQPDTTFGTVGIVQLDLADALQAPVSEEFPWTLVIDAEDRIVLAGDVYAHDVGTVSFVARFFQDGDPDPDFGSDGVALFDFGRGDERFHRIAFQDDGKILAGGSSDRTLILMRLLPDGTRDASFGTNGVVRNPDAALWGVNGIVLGPEGTITVASDLVLARFLPDGRLDPRFGDGGIATLHPGRPPLSSPGYEAIGGGTFAGLPDGGFVIGGGVHYPGSGLDQSDFALFRFRPDGSLEPGFGTSGLVTTDFPLRDSVRVWSDYLRAIVVQPDGHVVALGSDFQLARYRTDTSTSSEEPPTAAATALHAPFPNPTAGSTAPTLRFTLAHPGPARLALYDALGRRVAVLADGVHAAGTHTARLDADVQARLPAGVYLLRLDTDGTTHTRLWTRLR